MMTREERIKKSWEKFGRYNFDFSKRDIWKMPLLTDTSCVPDFSQKIEEQDTVEYAVYVKSMRVSHYLHGNDYIVYCENLILHKPKYLSNENLNRLMYKDKNGNWQQI